MAISPTRAFALGACSILVVTGVFVAGIGIGARNDADPTIQAPPLAERIECAAPPGFTASRAANERVADCEDAQRVQSMLLESGATAANVTVERRETGRLLGPETTTVVLAQVFLPDALERDWNADSAARAISRQLGTAQANVTITDERLDVLYDGGATTAVEISTIPGPSSTGSSDLPAMRPPARGPSSSPVR